MEKYFLYMYAIVCTKGWIFLNTISAIKALDKNLMKKNRNKEWSDREIKKRI